MEREIAELKIENERLNAQDAQLAEALRTLVTVNEEWNRAIEQIIERPAGWNAKELDAAKAALADTNPLRWLREEKAEELEQMPCSCRSAGFDSESHQTITCTRCKRIAELRRKEGA